MGLVMGCSWIWSSILVIDDELTGLWVGGLGDGILQKRRKVKLCDLQPGVGGWVLV